MIEGIIRQKDPKIRGQIFAEIFSLVLKLRLNVKLSISKI